MVLSDTSLSGFGRPPRLYVCVRSVKLCIEVNPECPGNSVTHLFESAGILFAGHVHVFTCALTEIGKTSFSVGSGLAGARLGWVSCCT